MIVLDFRGLCGVFLTFASLKQRIHCPSSALRTLRSRLESQMVAYFETACLRYVTSAEIYLALLQTMQIIFRLLLITVEQILN